MPELQLIDHASLPEAAGYAAPFCTARGSARSRFARPDGYAQWILTGRLGAGAEVAWQPPHGDEAVYLVSGRALVEGHGSATEVVAGGALVVEGGAAAALRAVEDCAVVHVGSAEPSRPAGGPTEGPPRAHVLGPEGIHVHRGSPEVVWYADSSCPTCSISFFRPSGTGPYVSRSHSHSQDELIHLLRGQLQVGRHTVGPGTTMAVPADRRYGFRSERDFSFLNYRRDLSYTTKDPKEPPIKDGIQPGG